MTTKHERRRRGAGAARRTGARRRRLRRRGRRRTGRRATSSRPDGSAPGLSMRSHTTHAAGGEDDGGAAAHDPRTDGELAHRRPGRSSRCAIRILRARPYGDQVSRADGTRVPSAAGTRTGHATAVAGTSARCARDGGLRTIAPSQGRGAAMSTRHIRPTASRPRRPGRAGAGRRRRRVRATAATATCRASTVAPCCRSMTYAPGPPSGQGHPLAQRRPRSPSPAQPVEGFSASSG